MRLVQIDRDSVRALVVLAITWVLAPSPLFAANANRVTVRMTEYMFVPNHLNFRRGVLYDLHLVNAGKQVHEFTAPEFIAAIDLRNPEVLGPYTNQFLVDPGQTKDVYFVPRKAGRYSLICADHDWAGMTGQIVVTP